MDNNNYSQPQYNQPYGQQPYAQAYGQPPVIDPTYESRAKDFLTKTIVSCCIAGIPVGSIIAIFMASNNRKALLEYIAQGGPHTTKLKVCSGFLGILSALLCILHPRRHYRYRIKLRRLINLKQNSRSSLLLKRRPFLMVQIEVWRLKIWWLECCCPKPRK